MFKTLSYKYTPSKQERSMLRFLCHISKNFHILNTYISISSFYDNEKIKYHSYYKGKRSLFKTSTNKIINAGISGALNIKVKLVDMIYYHS